MVRNSIKEVKVEVETGAEPITTTEAKAWVKMAYSTDDVLIGELIKTARKYAESYSGISIITKEVTVLFSHDAEKPVRLPRGPISDVSEVWYRECQLVEWTEITADDTWEVEGLDFKEFMGWAPGIYKVTFDAGYADGELPQDIRTALLKIFARLYENRGDVKGFELVQGEMDLLNNHMYRTWA